MKSLILLVGSLVCLDGYAFCRHERVLTADRGFVEVVKCDEDEQKPARLRGEQLFTMGAWIPAGCTNTGSIKKVGYEYKAVYFCE